jgi:type II secretory pathway pseudopilin PulG
MLEMIIAMVIMAVVFAVLVPQLRAIQRSWDTKAGNAETLQNARILMDHLQRTLVTARQISAVSSLVETHGFIQFLDGESNTYRYDVVGTTTKYIRYGPVGQLADLAGPVSRFQISCYDVNDMNAPLDPVLSPRDVRFIRVETTLTNSAGTGQDLTVTASAYLRTGAIGDETIPTLLFVSGGQIVGGGSCIPTAQENQRINLINSWGYTVNLIHHSQSLAEFDAAVVDANVAYVSGAVDAATLGVKLCAAPLGVVVEEQLAWATFGFASDVENVYTNDTINILDNTHYITMSYPIDVLVITTSPQPLRSSEGERAPALQRLASNAAPSSSSDMISVIDICGELYGGGCACGRRVQVPWGDTAFAFTSMNADGKNLMKRAIEWAAAARGSSGPGPGSGTYRDEFNASSYSGNDGTLAWMGDWVEINEDDGCVRGDEVVMGDPLASPRPPSNQLRVRDNDGGGEGVMRQANLEGAVTATLSFIYRRENLDDAGDYVAVEVSTNGTFGPWTEIDRFAGPDNESSYQPFSQDISAYIDSDFAIRFISSPNLAVTEGVWFDDVQIELSQ